MGKEKIIQIVALVVMLIGIGSSIYVYATEVNTDKITVNDQQYTIDQIFSIAEIKEVGTADYSGVALDDLVKKVGVGHPEEHEYTIIASDGYQKTVNWENMQNGILTKDRMIFFTDLPKAYRVKNVVEIEVI